MERNLFILQLYREGWSSEDLANRFHVSRSRINQILSRHGMDKHDRPKASSPEGEYSGVILPVALKAALRQAAKEDKTSMSAVIVDAIEKEMKRRGIPIQPPVLNEIDIPLPFD